MKQRTIANLAAVIVLAVAAHAKQANVFTTTAGNMALQAGCPLGDPAMPALPAKAPAVPAKAPALKLKNLQGRTFRLSDYKGKVVLVNFWATWCPPCRTEIPELIKWQREYRDRGLRVIGITYPPQTRAAVRRFTRKAGVNYPVALGTRATKLLFTPRETLPMTVVIDSEGNVHDVIEGIVFPEEFEQKIKPLLASLQTETRAPVR